MPGMQSDSSLWSLVRFKANTIVTKCIIENDGIGGFQLAGDRGGIKVTLYSVSGNVESRTLNETAETLSHSKPEGQPFECANDTA